MGVDDLLQKHSLLESDIHVLGERVKTVNLQANKFVDGDFSEVGGMFWKNLNTYLYINIHWIRFYNFLVNEIGENINWSFK